MGGLNILAWDPSTYSAKTGMGPLNISESITITML